MASLITLCNEALSTIAAGQIASLTEATLESRECARWAPTVLQEIADWTEWIDAIKRVALAPVTNDRAAEWLYAYAPPADMADPIDLRETEDAAQWLQPYGLGDFPMQDTSPIPFTYEGGVIYTNIENAVIIYSCNALDVGKIKPLVRRAFVLELAGRICLPIKKDAKLAQFVSQQAEMARNRAISDEQNKNPQRSPRYTSAAEWARMGIGV
jgi:hypothetical protein